MKNQLSLATMTLLLSAFAQAQYNDVGTYRSDTSILTYDNQTQKGFAGYLGLNAGYTGYNNHLDVEGAPTSVKLLGSYVSEEKTGVFDAGFGIQNQTFSQNSAADHSISTAVMEIATRYQFETRWQLGVIYNQFFSKGESYGANQADAEFGGIQLLREFNFGGNYLGRLGGHLLTSLNVNNESVNMAIIDFQMGWGKSPDRSTSTASAE